jgi:hypothetical protein
MKRDTSYDADIMQFGSVLPFETSLGGERNKGGMPTIVATEAQLDVMFSGSDPGSVGLDAARAMSIGGSQGDWTHTGTAISNLTDASDIEIRHVLGTEVQFRPFPKAGLSGQKAADIMTQFTGGGAEPVMNQQNMSGDAEQIMSVTELFAQRDPTMSAFFDLGDPHVSVQSTASDGDQRYDATTPQRFQRVARADTIENLSSIKPKSMALQRELQELRAQGRVTNSPRLNERPTASRSAEQKSNPRTKKMENRKPSNAVRGLNMDERVSTRSTRGKAAERLLETME